MSVERCQNHIDSSLWIREPVPDRGGWERAICSKCGVLIGFNPIDSDGKRKRTDKGVDLELTGGESVGVRDVGLFNLE